MNYQLVKEDDNETISYVEDIYKALHSQCKTARSRRSLEAVKAACDDISQGSRDFALAIVGRMASTKGGPTAQSISNKNGKRYRDLISVYQTAYPPPMKLKQSSKKNWVDNIQQPGIKGNVLILQTETAKLRAENQVLRNLLTHKDAPVTTLTATTPLSENTPPCLTETDYDSLNSSIDLNRLQAFGLKIGEGGSIENDNGDEVFHIGFVDAIKKIILMKDR